jgi:hypothetical protein
MRSGTLTVLAVLLLTLVHEPAIAQKEVSLPSRPLVENKTSLLISHVDVVIKGSPAYRLTVWNESAKSVTAIQLKTLQKGKNESSSLLVGEEDQPLIGPGESYEAVVSCASTVDAQALPEPTIVLTTAVFSDGTYQGDKGTAAKLSALAVGRKAAIGQLVPIFKDALNASDLESPEAMARFKQDVLDISDSIDEVELNKLTRRYQDQNGSLKLSAQNAVHLLRKRFLTDFEKFAAAQDGSNQRNAFREWLENADRTYRAWYSRL